MGAINSKSLIDDAIFSFSIGDEKTAEEYFIKCA
jgi:hypothetical protein